MWRVLAHPAQLGEPLALRRVDELARHHADEPARSCMSQPGPKKASSRRCLVFR
jgi:hypothetical protein